MLAKEDNDESKEEKKDTAAEKAAQPAYTKCNLHEFFNLVQQTRDLYDLRPAEAYNKSHVHGAKNISEAMVYTNLPHNEHVAATYNTPAFRQQKLTNFQSQNVLDLPVVLYGDKESISEQILVHVSKLILADKTTQVYVFDGDYETHILSNYAFLCKQQLSTTLSYPNMILQDALFLGDGFMAEDKGIMLDLGITHIVNVTGMSFMLNAEVKKNIKYLQLPLDDSTMDADKLAVYFDKAAQFIDDALLANNKHGKNRVYVHCMAGVSRSASIVIAYLMKSRKYSYCDAFMHVKKCRPRISPNGGFRLKLQEYEKSLFGSSTAAELEKALDGL